jgi:hypothetical protein
VIVCVRSMGSRGAADAFLILGLTTLIALMEGGYDISKHPEMGVRLRQCIGPLIHPNPWSPQLIQTCREALIDAVDNALQDGAANQSTLSGLGMMLLAEGDKEFGEVEESPYVFAFSADPASAEPLQVQEITIRVLDVTTTLGVNIDVSGTDGYKANHKFDVTPGSSAVTFTIPGAAAGTIFTIQASAGNTRQSFTTSVKEDGKVRGVYKGSFSGTKILPFEYNTCTVTINGNMTLNLAISNDGSYEGRIYVDGTQNWNCTAKAGHGSDSNVTYTTGVDETMTGTLPKLEWTSKTVLDKYTLSATITDTTVSGQLSIMLHVGGTVISAPITLTKL